MTTQSTIAFSFIAQVCVDENKDFPYAAGDVFFWSFDSPRSPWHWIHHAVAHRFGRHFHLQFGGSNGWFLRWANSTVIPECFGCKAFFMEIPGSLNHHLEKNKLLSLKPTARSPLRISSEPKKESFHLPNIHFQRLWLFVSGKVTCC